MKTFPHSQWQQFLFWMLGINASIQQILNYFQRCIL